ncbi:hypothetical protein [Chryseolinea soli]|uniref:Uncharacterized protein n=1 Tax=Chryseolinea soli TaxID=2321403 RepID=A0A385SQ77_9BACT|nr:hypothetical protein [Chryseolinea soli]AYB33012.1 hypothetical protein D4L85_21610 [Chryseolinea soli]
MKKVNILLMMALYPDNFTPKILEGEVMEWIKDDNFFAFPYDNPMYKQNMKRLKGYHYLQRVDVFYAALTCNN